MMFKTHLAFGFLLGLLGLHYVQPENQLLYMALVLFGSALPDIDHPRSVVGRKVKIVAFLFEHRGFFHSLFAVILAAGAAAAFLPLNYAYALSLGYFSHLLIDAVTLEGIMPFHPLTRWRIHGFLRTGAFYEVVVLIAIVLADGYWLIRL